MKKEKTILKSQKTPKEFFAELEKAEKDWEKNGGISFKKVMKKSSLSP